MRSDVIIVGGGPAGLSAALVLGRSRMQVVVCDAGQPRNAASQAAHGFLSREGAHPRELLRISRDQLRPFAVAFRGAAAVRAVQHAGGFEVELEDGSVVAARKLLLATGVVDVLPEIPGLRPLWGTSVFSCPYCHGWELRDQSLAVYGKAGVATERAVLLTAWTSDLIVCSDGPGGFSPEQASVLAGAGIPVYEQKIRRLKEHNGYLAGVEFADGSTIGCRGLFLKPDLLYTNALAKDLGCRLAQNGALQIDEKCQTSVASVYAAGDCTGASGQIAGMAAAGAKVAHAIVSSLVHENLPGNRCGDRSR